MTKILEIEQLKICFKNGKALNEVVKSIGFDLIRGEILGIVGESGSGKTVTALSIMQLLDRDNTIFLFGKINYFEKNSIIPLTCCLCPNPTCIISGDKESRNSFQEPIASLNPVHRCGDQVAEAIHHSSKISQEEAKNKVLEFLRKFN